MESWLNSLLSKIIYVIPNKLQSWSKALLTYFSKAPYTPINYTIIVMYVVRLL